MPSAKQIIAEGSPEDVLGLVKRRIRQQLGDGVENKAEVFAKSGKIYIVFEADEITYSFAMQRRSVPKFLKTLRNL